MTPEQHDGLAALISDAIYRYAKGDPEALAERIIIEIEAAGYEVVFTDLIPIRRNPNTPV